MARPALAQCPTVLKKIMISAKLHGLSTHSLACYFKEHQCRTKRKNEGLNFNEKLIKRFFPQRWLKCDQSAPKGSSSMSLSPSDIPDWLYLAPLAVVEPDPVREIAKFL